MFKKLLSIFLVLFFLCGSAYSYAEIDKGQKRYEENQKQLNQIPEVYRNVVQAMLRDIFQYIMDEPIPNTKDEQMTYLRGLSPIFTYYARFIPILRTELQIMIDENDHKHLFIENKLYGPLEGKSLGYSYDINEIKNDMKKKQQLKEKPKHRTPNRNEVKV